MSGRESGSFAQVTLPKLMSDLTVQHCLCTLDLSNGDGIYPFSFSSGCRNMTLDHLTVVGFGPVARLRSTPTREGS